MPHRRFSIRALAVSVLTLAGATLAAAEPRTIDDCEKIQGDHEYNLCLASFGTKRGERAVAPQAAAPVAAPARRGSRFAAREARGSRYAPASRGNGVVFTRGRSGRVSAQIDLAPRRTFRRR